MQKEEVHVVFSKTITPKSKQIPVFLQVRSGETYKAFLKFRFDGVCQSDTWIVANLECEKYFSNNVDPYKIPLFFDEELKESVGFCEFSGEGE